MNRKATKPGEEFRPSAKERRLLEVLLNPENRFLTITKVCEIAGINRVSYYRMFARPEFVAYYRQESAALATRFLGQIMNSMHHMAVRGSFPHAKVLLEMAGVYTPEQKVSLEVQRELEAALDRLRSGLSPDEYQRVLGVLADQSAGAAAPADGNEPSA